MYEHEHHKKMSSGAIAAMLSTILYYRRFFPYYVHNIIGGLDEEGINYSFPLTLSFALNLRLGLQPGIMISWALG